MIANGARTPRRHLQLPNLVIIIMSSRLVVLACVASCVHAWSPAVRPTLMKHKINVQMAASDAAWLAGQTDEAQVLVLQAELEAAKMAKATASAEKAAAMNALTAEEALAFGADVGILFPAIGLTAAVMGRSALISAAKAREAKQAQEARLAKQAQVRGATITSGILAAVVALFFVAQPASKPVAKSTAPQRAVAARMVKELAKKEAKTIKAVTQAAPSLDVPPSALIGGAITAVAAAAVVGLKKDDEAVEMAVDTTPIEEDAIEPDAVDEADDDAA